MKLRAFAVAGLLMLTVSGVASSKPPRVTLASLALQEFSVPEPRTAPRSLTKATVVPELDIAIKKPDGKRGSGDYYESQGYTTTTVTATAPDWCLSASSGGVAKREKQRDKVVVYAQGKQWTAQSLHLERVVTEGNATYLLAKSYWLDAATGKVELAEDHKVRLTRVASRGGLSLYAFRGSRELHLVISAPENSAMVAANGGATRLGCGLKRLSFPLSEQPDLALSFALGFPEKDAKPVAGLQAQPVPLAEALRISASISQTSRDPAPVVSVTIARTNRTIRTTLEQQMPRWTEILSKEELESL